MELQIPCLAKLCVSSTSGPRLLAAGSSILRRLAVIGLHDEQCFGRQSARHQLRPLHVRHAATHVPCPTHPPPCRSHDRRRLAGLRAALDAVDRGGLAQIDSSVCPVDKIQYPKPAIRSQYPSQGLHIVVDRLLITKERSSAETKISNLACPKYRIFCHPRSVL